jgi:WD40 repeat protein
VFTIQAMETDCTRLRFSATTQYLLVGDGCEVWELPPGKAALHADNVPCGVEWHPKKAELYVPNGALGLDVLSPTGKRLQRLTKECWKTSWVQGMCFSPYGDWLVTFEPFQLTGLKRVRDNWQVKWMEENDPDDDDRDSFESVAPFPDGERVLVLIVRFIRSNLYYPRVLVQRDITTGKVLSERELPDKQGPLGVRTRLHITPDGSTVIGMRGRSVYCWPIDPKDTNTRKTTVAKKDVLDVALHPSGKWILVASGSPEVSVWDTTTWQCVKNYNWRIGPVQSVGVSPDGTLAAAGTEACKIAVWDWDL